MSSPNNPTIIRRILDEDFERRMSILEKKLGYTWSPQGLMKSPPTLDSVQPVLYPSKPLNSTTDIRVCLPPFNSEDVLIKEESQPEKQANPSTVVVENKSGEKGGVKENLDESSNIEVTIKTFAFNHLSSLLPRPSRKGIDENENLVLKSQFIVLSCSGSFCIKGVRQNAHENLILFYLREKPPDEYLNVVTISDLNNSLHYDICRGEWRLRRQHGIVFPSIKLNLTILRKCPEIRAMELNVSVEVWCSERSFWACNVIKYLIMDLKPITKSSKYVVIHLEIDEIDLVLKIAGHYFGAYTTNEKCCKSFSYASCFMGICVVVWYIEWAQVITWQVTDLTVERTSKPRFGSVADVSKLGEFTSSKHILNGAGQNMNQRHYFGITIIWNALMWHSACDIKDIRHVIRLCHFYNLLMDGSNLDIGMHYIITWRISCVLSWYYGHQILHCRIVRGVGVEFVKVNILIKENVDVVEVPESTDVWQQHINTIFAHIHTHGWSSFFYEALFSVVHDIIHALRASCTYRTRCYSGSILYGDSVHVVTSSISLYKKKAEIVISSNKVSLGEFWNSIRFEFSIKSLFIKFELSIRSLFVAWDYIQQIQQLMKGIANEAYSLAAHWGLGKLIAFYDDNHNSIDGDTLTENVDARFEALGWHVIWVKNGNTGYDEIRAAIKEANAVTDKPTLIKVTATIGFGSPNKANLYRVHDSADLASSNMTLLKMSGDFQKATSEERNIRFGVREHAMGALVPSWRCYEIETLEWTLHVLLACTNLTGMGFVLMICNVSFVGYTTPTVVNHNVQLYWFAMPRPPEIADLEDKVCLKGEGMLRFKE